MEFLSANLYDTTTAITVNSSTITVDNILDPNSRRQYVSDGFANDSTTTTITISFDQTVTVDRLAILGHNVKAFDVFYNGATANTFALSGPTTVSQFLSNSATSLYLVVSTPVACTSVTFDLKSTIVANSEKAVGFIYIGENEFTFPRIPNASGYTPTWKAKELVHELSDGGTRRHLIRNKWEVRIKLKYIEESFRDDLKEIYETNEPLTFVPFGTGTAWDGILFEANWTGPFDFYKYSDDAEAAGFTGSILLKET